MSEYARLSPSLECPELADIKSHQPLARKPLSRILDVLPDLDRRPDCTTAQHQRVLRISFGPTIVFACKVSGEKQLDGHLPPTGTAKCFHGWTDAYNICLQGVQEMERKWPMRGTGCGTENDILVDLVRGDLPLKAEGPHFGYGFESTKPYLTICACTIMYGNTTL